ncbi:plasmid replication/partition related protein [Ideonella sp. B7]|uniref:plasmid replication/partition related protein n=1 Tax=Ideonella benzenivorans TaxID=2831643 RepID=UPI001CEC7160|nr:plasmid replication/partition related protein [Ideonella benzenivorans]MCA6218539.1 plasmid replication/partition related protein [Ideonella benzenivorans]
MSDTPTIVIHEGLQAYIDPLRPEEEEALEQSLLAEGCREALVLWGDVLVDGHNRYRLCTQHGIPFRTVQNPRLKTLEDVQLWMIDQQLGRRSVSNYQRGVLALRKRELLETRRSARMAALADAAPVAVEAAAPAQGEAATPPWDGEGTPPAEPAGAAAPTAEPKPLDSREAVAKAARLSSAQVQMIEKIQHQAAPEVVAAVRAGTLSINAAAAVATLPAEEQAAAAQAGADELKQAAKRVREAKRKPKAAAEGSAPADGGETLDGLRQRVAALEAENAELRRQLAALGATPAV